MTGTRNGYQNEIATSAAGSAAGKRVNRARPPTKAKTDANNYFHMHTIICARDTLSWIRVFCEKLVKMNREKIDRLYSYMNSMIVYVLLIMSLINFNWRITTGDACSHYEDLQRHSILYRYRFQDMPFLNYMIVQRRVKRMFMDMLVSENGRDDRIISSYVSSRVKRRHRTGAVDSIGFNLSKTNLWRRNKWGISPDYRGQIKMHTLIYVNTNEIIAYILTTDKMGDNTTFRMLTNTAFNKGHVFDTIYVDSAYEAKENWEDSMKQGYMLLVKFKSNYNEKINGCMARNIAARST